MRTATSKPDSRAAAEGEAAGERANQTLNTPWEGVRGAGIPVGSGGGTSLPPRGGPLAVRISESPRQRAQATVVARLSSRPRSSFPTPALQRVRGRQLESVPTAEVEAYFDQLTKKLRKMLIRGFGVSGARGRRSDELKAFRGRLKEEARGEARSQVDAAIDETPGIRYETEKRYYAIEAKKKVYRTAKGSVRAILEGHVERIVQESWVGDRAHLVGEALAFPLGVSPGRRALLREARRFLDRAWAERSAQAHTIKQSVVKPLALDEQDRVAVPEMDPLLLVGEVWSQVQRDDLGRKALQQVIQADSVEAGIGVLGGMLDQLLPASGDQLALSVEIRVPIPDSPAYVSFTVSGKAARGTDAMTAGVPKWVDPRRLEVMFELAFGVGAQLIGIDVNAGVSAFIRAGADSTELCMKAMSYGAYRSLSKVSDTAANWWAGRTEGVQEGKTLRAESWAAMVEEQAFNHGEAYVDLGGGIGGSATAKAPGAEIGGELAFGLFRRFDKASLVGSMGDAVFARPVLDKEAAKARRRAAAGATGGSFDASLEIEAEIAGQAVAFAGSFSKPIGSPGWGAEISATITHSVGDATELERWGAGFATGALRLLSSLVALASKRPGAVIDGVSEIVQIANSGLGGAVSNALADLSSVDGSISSLAIGTAPGTIPDRLAEAVTSSNFQIAVIFGHDGEGVVVRIELRSGQQLEINAMVGSAGVKVSAEKTKRLLALGYDEGGWNAEALGVRARKTEATPGRPAHRN